MSYNDNYFIAYIKENQVLIRIVWEKIKTLTVQIPNL